MHVRRIRRPSTGLVMAVVGLLLVLVGTASAGTIWGTPRADHLRGTAKADQINGSGGNDTLLGLGGNDVLVGGPGNDRLVGGAGADTMNCGPGKDTAVADGRDKISSSCEVVIGLPKPALSIADALVAEGNSDTKTLSFPVYLSAASTKPVSVEFATTDGTATAPSDYTAVSGTLTLAPGERHTTIDVVVLGDTNVEPEETFMITLSNPVNATIADASAAGFIQNDDQ